MISELSEVRTTLARNAYALHNAARVVHLNHVADLDGTLEQENESRDEVIDDVLQAEAETDAERAGEDRELRHVEAHRRDGDEKSDEQNHVMQHRRDGVGHAARQMHARVHVLFEQEAQEARQQKCRVHRDGEERAHRRVRCSARRLSGRRSVVARMRSTTGARNESSSSV